MKKNKFNPINFYNNLGNILCGLAAAIVGYLYAGPIIALLAAVAGVVLARFASQNLFNFSHSN